MSRKHLGLHSVLQDFYLFYLIVNSFGSMKPGIALNLVFKNTCNNLLSALPLILVKQNI